LHPRLRCAKTVSVSRWALCAGIGALVLALVTGSSVLTYFLTSKYVSKQLLSSFSPLGVIGAEASADALAEELIDTDAAYMRVGVGQGAAPAPVASADRESEADRQSAFLRRNLDALAERLGHVQARLTRLDALGERVASMAGVEARPATPTLADAATGDPAPTVAAAPGGPAGGAPDPDDGADKVMSGKTPVTAQGAAKATALEEAAIEAAAARKAAGKAAKGGAGASRARQAPATGEAESVGQGGPLLPDHGALTVDELAQAIAEVATTLEQRADQLNLIESEFLFQRAASRLVPTARPLATGYMASRFGRRVDPLTGRRARHEGLDFAAPRGTPILAAGPGVVIVAGRHHAYGNQVDIDHGDGLVTRYAHARKLFVKVGDIVHQGDKIAEVGSTGRSTGPHLHFEVRIDDAPQDPMKFLGNPVAFESARKAIAASN